MSSFTDDLNVTFIGGTELMRVGEGICFYSSIHAPGLQVCALPGIISDGDSIPWIIRPIVRASKRQFQAAYVVVHDPLYKLWAYYNILHPKMEVLEIHEPIKKISLHLADKLLDEGLDVLGANWYKRGKVYTGLRMFGSPGKPDTKLPSGYTNAELWDNAWQYTELIQWETIDEAKAACGNETPHRGVDK